LLNLLFTCIFIAPIVAISNEGYSLSISTEKVTFKGSHGFNNSLDSMKAIFLGRILIFKIHFFYFYYSFLKARGPNFIKNKKINGFKNVDVYPFLFSLLKIDCNHNNGTLESFKSVLIEKSSSTRINANSLFFIFVAYYLLIKSVDLFLL
jgi:hypothetical protein